MGTAYMERDRRPSVGTIKGFKSIDAGWSPGDYRIDMGSVREVLSKGSKELLSLIWGWV